MMVEKNKEYVVKIIDNGCDGEGIAKIDNFTIFINDAIKGEKCKILILKVNKNFAYGKIIEIITKSELKMIVLHIKGAEDVILDILIIIIL